MSHNLSFTSLSAAAKPWIELTRVHKFAGTMMLVWPFSWSLTMAAYALHIPVLMFLAFLAFGFIACSILHRYDVPAVFGTIYWIGISIVKLRTKHRPIADGRISVTGAIAFLTIHLLILVRMISALNDLAWIVGLVAIFVLPGIYPLMKRITYWPQAWLGIALNMGIMMSWASLTGHLPRSAFVLITGSWAWTIWYDTIYACQDKKDDVNAGVKSTALLFGNRTKIILSFFGSIIVASLLIAGLANNQGPSYHLISVGGAAVHLSWQLWQVDLDNPKSCWDTFHRNGFEFGSIVWSGAMLDYLTMMYLS